jgi:DNA-binding NtrC family response regulator
MFNDYPKVLLLGYDVDSGDLYQKLAVHAAVTEAPGIEPALALLKSQDIDAVFCPWRMPDGTWRELLAKLKQLHLEVPVVVVCHCGGECEWIEVLNAGGFDLIAPPYDSYQLGALLKHVTACAYGVRQHGIGAQGSGMFLAAL